MPHSSNRHPPLLLALMLGLATTAFAVAAPYESPAAAAQEPQALALDRLEAAAELAGDVPIIVQLRTDALPAIERPHGQGDDIQRAQRKLTERARLITRAQRRLATAMAGHPARLAPYRYLPLTALRADRDTIRRLRSLPEVLSISEDRTHAPLLNTSVPRMGGTLAYAQGNTGAGQAVAVIDTGVQTSHPDFAGRLLSTAEACFSGSGAGVGSQVAAGTITSLCPNLSPCPDTAYPDNTACGPGAGVQCTGHGSCWHGTHVAGIAVGNNSTYRGVAPGANLIPIQVFVIQGGSLVAYDSDIIAGLEHVLALSQAGTEIAAVNMSLGGDVYSSTRQCDLESAATKTAIDALRAAGIATVIAAGNNGNKTGISSPGCISSAVSVGATDDSDAIAGFSNLATALNVFAPGVSVTSTVPTNSLGTANGTSMASPHVAGAFAVMRQKAAETLLNPSVSNLLAALRATGIPIAYGANAYNTPRIQLDQALALVQEPLPIEVIMDSQTAASGITTLSGSFAEVVDVNAYGGTALRGTSASQANTLRIDSELVTGYYDVALWWPVLSGNNSQARVTVRHVNGTAQHLVDQQRTGGRWNRLGTYQFGSGAQSARVEVSSTGGPAGVVADALKFVRVEAVDPLDIQADTLPVAYVGVPYSAQLSVSGGLAPLTWSLADGTLPVGLVLDAATGAIDGIPSAIGSQQQSYQFVVRATDLTGNEAIEAFLIVVAQPDVFARAQINFQPANAPVPPGYLVDSGAVFGDRGNGQRYGWATNTAANTRDRNDPISPDQRYDTVNYAANGTERWELQVPNGSYEVRVVAGDPSFYGQVAPRRYHYLVEGESVLDHVPNTQQRFEEGAVIVTVSDGRLTLTNGANALANSLAFLEVTAQAPGNLAPSVALTAPVAGASFAPGTPILLTATASDTDGSIAKVEFFADGGKLGEVAAAPFDLAWTGAPAGSHTLQAVATDDTGATAVSATIAITVVDTLPPPLQVKVNFQPAAAAVPADYLVDSGAVFGDRGNGQRYGWATNTAANTRDRNDPISPDQRYDTVNYAANGTERWELQVPNGSYEVRVVAGDPSFYGQVAPRRYHYLVEGESVLDHVPNTQQRFEEGAVIVTVSDGRLTLTNGANALANSLAFLEVTAQAPGNLAPSVALTAPVAGASFAPGTPILLTATASDTDGSIAKVEFFADGGKLGEVTAAPFDLAWTAAPAGSHTLQAVATDDTGATAVSATIAITVVDTLPPPLQVKVNFQPAAAAVPAGYLVDSGAVFGDRGNGQRYGWATNTAANTRDRNNPTAPDQRYDTLNYAPSGTERWELQVPNGSYEVRVVAGDPSFYGQVAPRRYHYLVEGFLVLDHVPSAAQPFKEGTVNVTVTDGRLTLTNGVNALSNSLVFVEARAP